MPATARALVAALLLASSGCSLTSMTRPPTSTAGDAEPECTRSRAAPRVDVVMAIIGGAVAIAAAAQATFEICGDDRGPCSAVLNVYGAVGAFTGFVYGISARTGYQWTARCDELHRDWRAGLRRGD